MAVIADVEDDGPRLLAVHVQHVDEPHKVMAASAVVCDVDPPAMDVTVNVNGSALTGGSGARQEPVHEDKESSVQPMLMNAVAVVRDTEPQVLNVAITVTDAA